MKKLLEKVAVVTGAAQGIGKGIAHVLAEEGATTALLDVSQNVHDVTEVLRDSGVKAFAYHVDVADAADVHKSIKNISRTLGKVDILVNNAGIALFSPFLEMSLGDRDRIFDVNINGVWNCTKAVVPLMIDQNYGKIVNISSVTGPRVATLGLTAYAASKGAISAFTRALALEVAEYKITVNAILPGFIDTPLTKPMADDFGMNNKAFSQWLDNSIPLKRMGTIEEVGNLALFLASDDSKYITGQEIIIDGGNTIQEIKNKTI
jgi:NAD(P)-dependent dehydrogenase (short-subunit alcohol dehydrogenase family)